jgi:hypothetical protein
MPVYAHRGIIGELLTAFERADRDGTAALNALIYGSMVVIAGSVALVAIGGFGGVVAWMLVWAAGLGAAAAWIAPHLADVQRGERLRLVEQQVAIEAARRMAIDILLDDDARETERRSAAAVLTADEV